MGRRRDLFKRALEQAFGRELAPGESSEASTTGPGTGDSASEGAGAGGRGRSRGLVDAVRQASEQSARKVLTEAFDERKTDLEEMAVRALRRAIEDEGQRLERLIEKTIEIKKREVRLSLLVLFVATSLYVVLALTLG
jgi:hypothetical protein